MGLGCYGEEFWCQGWEQTGFVGEFERKTREKLKENKGRKRRGKTLERKQRRERAI